MRYCPFLFCLLLILLGCEKELDIKVPFKGQKLVINAFNNPDSVWSMKLSLTRHVLDSNDFFRTPQSAEVTVIDPTNNAFFDVLTPNNLYGNNYRGNLKPEPGKEYLIRVVTSDFGTAEAYSVIPISVPISKIEIDSSTIIQDGNLKLKIRFLDPSSQRNFYKLNMLANAFYLHYLTGDTVRFTNNIPFELDGTSLTEDGISPSELFIADTFFDGDEHVLAVRINIQYFNSTYTTSVKVILSHVTESYYQYASTLALQQQTTGDPFAQPVQVYNNIKNGFGIFAGYNQSVRVLK